MDPVPASIKYRPSSAPKWCARVRERSGKVTEMLLIGPLYSEEELAAHVRAHFPAVEYLDGRQTNKEPPIIAPVPKSFYMNGIIDAVNKELQGSDYNAARPRRILIPRQTIERKV